MKPPYIVWRGIGYGSRNAWLGSRDFMDLLVLSDVLGVDAAVEALR